MIFILCSISQAVGHTLIVLSMGWCKGVRYVPGNLPEETAGGDYNSLRISYRYCCPVGPWNPWQVFAPRSDFGREAMKLFLLHGHRAAWPGPIPSSKLDLGLSLWTLLGAR